MKSKKDRHQGEDGQGQQTALQSGHEDALGEVKCRWMWRPGSKATALAGILHAPVLSHTLRSGGTATSTRPLPEQWRQAWAWG